MTRVRAIPGVLLLLLVASPGLIASQPPALDLLRSRLLTESVPDVPFGQQWSPVVRVTPNGFCAAWIDTRQGGAVMGARIDAAGRLLDPFGVPVASLEGESWAPWKIDIIRDQSRCLFIHGSGTRVLGRSVSIEGLADPQTIELFDGGNIYWQVSGSDGTKALVSVHHPWGLQLYLVDTAGTVLWSHPIETDYYQVRAVIRGETALVLVQPGDRTGYLDLWEVGREGATLFETDVLSSEIDHWRVVDEGESLLIADSHPANDGGPIRLDRITATGETVISWFPTTMTQPLAVSQMWRMELGSIAMMGSSFNQILLYRVSGTDVDRMATIEDVQQVAISSSTDGDLFSVWKDSEAEQLRYRFGLPEAGAGTALTGAARLELIADAVATPSGIQILWVEASPTTAAQRLLRGTLDPASLELIDHEELSTGVVVGPAISDEVFPRAAMAERDGVVQMAWIEGSDLLIRRMSHDGSWNESPKIIGARAQTLHPDGLISTPEGFLLVWSEGEEGGSHDFPSLRVAWIGDDGSLEVDAPSVARDLWSLSWPSAVEVEDEILIFARGGMQICRFLCPPSWQVRVVSVNREREWSAVEIPEIYVLGMTTVAASGRNVLLVNGNQTRRFVLSGGALQEEGALMRQFAGASTIAWRDGFVIASREHGTQGTSSRTVIATTDDQSLNPIDRVELFDAGSPASFEFLPSIVPFEHRLYVFGSEVSLVPEEGGVRRLRVWELASEYRRRAATRRP